MEKSLFIFQSVLLPIQLVLTRLLIFHPLENIHFTNQTKTPIRYTIIYLQKFQQIFPSLKVKIEIRNP